MKSSTFSKKMFSSVQVNFAYNQYAGGSSYTGFEINTSDATKNNNSSY